MSKKNKSSLLVDEMQGLSIRGFRNGLIKMVNQELKEPFIHDLTSAEIINKIDLMTVEFGGNLAVDILEET